MAYNKAAASQLQAGIITDSHISASASIAETKLNIDWQTHGNEILSRKLVVDFVQVNGKGVTATSSELVVTGDISAPVANADTEKGAVVQAGKNKVIIRNAATGEPFLGVANKEVYGRLTHDGTDYKLSFFTKDELNAEVVHAFAGDETIDFQFPQRFDFLTVVETFASNEKFVDGAADVTTRLDFTQLALDIFGAGYTYDHDGVANRPKTLAQELADEVTRATDAESALDQRLDAVEAEITAARDGEASVLAKINAIDTAIATNEQAIADEITNRISAVTAEETARIAADEALDLRVDALETEVTAAREGQANLDSRLDGIDAAIGAVHKHYREDVQLTAGHPAIGTSILDLSGGQTFVAGNKSLDVYVNGFLQMVGVHYVERTDAEGRGIGVNFAPEIIAQDFVVQFRWEK